jgi:hypothetical protein
MYPQLTDLREAEHAIGLAHDAAATGRYDDARRLLDVAATRTEQVTDPAARQRLRDRIAELRRSLPAGTGPIGGAGPTAQATPATTAVPTPVSPPGATAPAPTSGAGRDQRPAPDNPLPGLKPLQPSLPVPKLPVPKLPVPTLPLPPSLLPTLPGLGSD